MFNFGRIEDTVSLYMNQSIKRGGPGVGDYHYDEMSVDELKLLFAYTYGAFRMALRDAASAEIIKYINQEYDKVFQAVVDNDPSFSERVRKGDHIFLPDYSPETVAKYRKMAGILDS